MIVIILDISILLLLYIFREFYLCDKCNVVKLSESEFVFNHRDNLIYCDSCYNWLTLKHGMCNNCGTIKTVRHEYIMRSIDCDCGSVIELD